MCDFSLPLRQTKRRPRTIHGCRSRVRSSPPGFHLFEPAFWFLLAIAISPWCFLRVFPEERVPFATQVSRSGISVAREVWGLSFSAWPFVAPLLFSWCSVSPLASASSGLSEPLIRHRSSPSDPRPATIAVFAPRRLYFLLRPASASPLSTGCVFLSGHLPIQYRRGLVRCHPERLLQIGVPLDWILSSECRQSQRCKPSFDPRNDTYS
mmetsp:Transcript_6098/g.12561  ORF Transcript_6098/g.12561 Transcript_6098/m.12561 type:complete len:209 (-) Transcript_6098:506-1132(-)